MHKPKKKPPGCLTNLLFAILIIVLAFFVYRWITGLGSAKFIIAELTIGENVNRNGEVIQGSKLVTLKLKNVGSQPGNFALDMGNYLEAQKLEGKDPDLVWTFKTELYYPKSQKWIEISNSDNWRGTKIIPGALSITAEKNAIIELKAYMKDAVHWRIRLPEELANDSIPITSPPECLKISILSPPGNVTDSQEIDL